MGNFFTSTLIYNSDAADKDKFIDAFCKAMEKEGYIPCDGDEAEKRYILKFADNCKWVTITSESYEQGNQTALSDTGRIAKMLKTTCINTTVIDSDCAVMEMYDQSGKKADTIVMGRADDYFGDHLPKLSEQNWKPFLAEGKKWEQLCDIVQNSEGYTFIEDGLSELAPIIGMDEGNILFHADIAEEDEQTVFLNFKKAEAKEKKLSLNAAFKQVFGELLEPLGFKLIKSKYPYYLRVVGEGIIQSVSVAKEKSIDDPNEEGFSIYVGVNLVSSPMPNFDKSPIIFDNMGWMKSLDDFHRNFLQYLDGFNKEYEEHSLFYKKGDTGEMLDAINKSRQDFMPFVLEYIEKINTLEDIYQAGFIVEVAYHDATILLERIDKKIEKMKKELPEKIKEVESYFANNPLLLKSKKEMIMWNFERRLKYYSSLKKGGEAYDDYIKTAEETKDKNLKILKEYGIIADEDKQTAVQNVKKEKKLTLNAAFIQIFGEALEPLGFVKIKNKHPYFVRVVNGEILHVLTLFKDEYYKNRYDIYAGIATVYRPLLDFDQDPCFNANWMSPVGAFEDYKAAKTALGMYYEYDLNNQPTMIDTLSTALEHTKQYILPILEKVSDLQKVIEYYAIYNSAALYIYSAKDMSEYNRDDNEGFLYIKINDHSDMKAEYEKGLERERFMIEKGKSNFDLNKLTEMSEKSRKERIMNRDAIYNDQELHNRVLDELSSNRALNLNRLQKYGLPIDKI